MTPGPEQPGNTAAAVPGIQPAAVPRIREARENAGMTRDALATALGATQACVSDWESGKRDVTVTELMGVAAALGLPASALLPSPAAAGDDAPGLVPVTGDGYFAVIAFMGHNEYTGYVTQVTKHGQPAYHIDLPEKLWGGNPLAWVEYAATAWFSERPVSEDSVRAAWEAQLQRAAAERARAETGWQRREDLRALEAGSDDGDNNDGWGEF